MKLFKLFTPKEKTPIEYYAKKRAYDANGASIDILIKGTWDGEVFSSFDSKGLETRIYKKEWIFTIEQLK